MPIDLNVSDSSNPAIGSAVRVTYAYRLRSAPNQRLHWRTKAKQTKAQRAGAWYALAGARPTLAKIVAAGPVLIQLTRIGPRELDDDNVQGAFKAIRDGVADALGIDDGDKRLTWLYAQERAKTYAVQIVITNGDAKGGS